MKNVVTLLVLVASPPAFAQPVEPVSPAQPAAPAQPTWFIGARIGLIGSLLEKPALGYRFTWNNAAPLAQAEAGRYVSANTAVVVGVMGAVHLMRSGQSSTLRAATLGAEWHTRTLLVGVGAGVVGERTRSQITYGPILAIRGGTELPAGPVLIQVMAEISALRFESPNNDPPGTSLAFSLSVGIRASRTR